MRHFFLNWSLTLPTRAILMAAFLGMAISQADWSDALGVPVHKSPFGDMTQCQTVANQTICYDTFDMWYGEDAFPVYYIENGTLKLFWRP